MSATSPCCTINSHTFPLHDVDIIFRAGIIAVRAQGSPEVGPQFSMSSDKGTNYFSVGKREMVILSEQIKVCYSSKTADDPSNF